MPAPHGFAIRTHLPMRAITADDSDRLAVWFSRLSDTARYQRFLGHKTRLSAAELRYLTDIDHRTHDALAALDPLDGSFIGVARYASFPEAPATADFAFAVADAWHGRGVGSLLGRELLARASANGIALMTATTLAENRPARAALRRLGFRTRTLGAGVVELELALA